MKSWLVRPLVWTAGGMALLIALTAAAIRLDQYILRWRAERLQSDIRSLELRKSTYADARRVVDRWRGESRDLGPCRGEWCDVEISFADFAWNQSTFILNTPVRSKIFHGLGARPAAVDATIRV